MNQVSRTHICIEGTSAVSAVRPGAALFAKRSFVSLIVLGCSLVGMNAAFAQSATPPPLQTATAADEPEKEQLEANRIDPKRQKPIGLFIGVEHQEKLPFLPPGAKFKGDYKKVSRLSLDSDRNILLFQATQEGFATLTVTDKDNNRLYEFYLDVKKSNLTKVVREMRALLADIEGITRRSSHQRDDPSAVHVWRPLAATAREGRKSVLGSTHSYGKTRASESRCRRYRDSFA